MLIGSLYLSSYRYIRHIKYAVPGVLSLGIFTGYKIKQHIDENLLKLKAQQIHKHGYKPPGEVIDSIKERLNKQEQRRIRKGLAKYKFDPQSWH